MKFAATLSAILCLLFTSQAHGDIIVNAGNPVLQANQANQVISVLVTSTDAVQGLNFNFQVEPLGAQPAPLITGVDIVGAGTVFSINNTGSSGDFLGDAGANSQIAIASTTTTAGTIIPNGILAFVTFDTTGLGAGSYVINMDNTVNGALDFSGVPVTTFQGTSLSIVTAVPEPSTIAVLSAVGIGAIFRRYRKSRTSSLHV